MSTMLRRIPGVLLATIILGSISAQTPSAIEQRIQRIQELPPSVIVKGEPVATTKLADPMAALHVPGVSIAVIHDGKIEWARGSELPALAVRR